MSNHVEVLRHMKNTVLASPSERKALDAAIAALSAPQPPAEAQSCPECHGTGGHLWHEADGSERGERCGTCDGFGHVTAPQNAPVGVNYAKLAEYAETYRVNYNVLCHYVREALAPQPPSGWEVVYQAKDETLGAWFDVEKARWDNYDSHLRRAVYTAPPSAPVGVEDKARAMFEAQADELAAPWDRQWEPTKDFWRKRAAAALAQQSAASLDAVKVPEPVADGQNGNVRVIEAARDAFPAVHAMYAALDHAAAELAALDATARRQAQQPAAVDGANARMKVVGRVARHIHVGGGEGVSVIWNDMPPAGSTLYALAAQPGGDQ